MLNTEAKKVCKRLTITNMCFKYAFTNLVSLCLFPQDLEHGCGVIPIQLQEPLWGQALMSDAHSLFQFFFLLAFFLSVWLNIYVRVNLLEVIKHIYIGVLMLAGCHTHTFCIRPSLPSTVGSSSPISYSHSLLRAERDQGKREGGFHGNGQQDPSLWSAARDLQTNSSLS